MGAEAYRQQAENRQKTPVLVSAFVSYLQPRGALRMTESALLPDTNTIALWMLVAITMVIAAKVVTGALVGSATQGDLQDPRKVVRRAAGKTSTTRSRLQKQILRLAKLRR